MTQSPLVALYPGTFDPLTKGHMDIITRAAHIADTLVIGVASNVGKAPLFSLKERVSMAEEEAKFLRATGVRADIQVKAYDILLMKFAIQIGARVIIRGLRAVSDFEYEFQMAGMNLRLNPTIETIFLMASDRHQFISSSMVKEVGRLDGDIEQFVSLPIAAAIRQKFDL